MNIENLKSALEECARFQAAAIAAMAEAQARAQARAKDQEAPSRWTSRPDSPIYYAAAKRASMDLTRALARLRQS